MKESVNKATVNIIGTLAIIGIICIFAGVGTADASGMTATANALLTFGTASLLPAIIYAKVGK